MYVISWFGWEVLDYHFIEKEEFEKWIFRIELLCIPRKWRFLRLGNPIDLIIGSDSISVTRRQFFEFQKEFEALNEEFGFRFSGLLSMMHRDTHATDDDCAAESYVHGHRRYGNSVGRPLHHNPRRPGRQRKHQGIAGGKRQGP